MLRQIRDLETDAREQAERATELAQELTDLRDQLRDLQDNDNRAISIAEQANRLNEQTDRTIAEIL